MNKFYKSLSLSAFILLLIQVTFPTHSQAQVLVSRRRARVQRFANKSSNPSEFAEGFSFFDNLNPGHDTIIHALYPESYQTTGLIHELIPGMDYMQLIRDDGHVWVNNEGNPYAWYGSWAMTAHDDKLYVTYSPGTPGNDGSEAALLEITQNGGTISQNDVHILGYQNEQGAMAVEYNDATDTLYMPGVDPADPAHSPTECADQWDCGNFYTYSESTGFHKYRTLGFPRVIHALGLHVDDDGTVYAATGAWNPEDDGFSTHCRDGDYYCKGKIFSTHSNLNHWTEISAPSDYRVWDIQRAGNYLYATYGPHYSGEPTCSILRSKDGFTSYEILDIPKTPEDNSPQYAHCRTRMIENNGSIYTYATGNSAHTRGRVLRITGDRVQVLNSAITGEGFGGGFTYSYNPMVVADDGLIYFIRERGYIYSGSKIALYRTQDFSHIQKIAEMVNPSTHNRFFATAITYWPARNSIVIAEGGDEANGGTNTGKLWEIRLSSSELQPYYDFQVTPTEGFYPLTVQASLNYGQSSIVSAKWDFDGDGIVDSTGLGTQTFTYKKPGVYSVEVKIEDDSGHTVSVSKDNYVHVTDPVHASFDSEVIENNGSSVRVKFSDTSTSADPDNPIVSWEWDFDNDGSIDSVEQNPIHTYTGFGVFDVKLTVKLADNIHQGSVLHKDVAHLYMFDDIGTDPLIPSDMLTFGHNSSSADWIDMNNDGILDLFLSNGQNLSREQNALFSRTSLTSPFVAVNNALTETANSSGQATWGDIDNDGDLDLFVPNFNLNEKDKLYRNDGNSVFTDVSDQQANFPYGVNSTSGNFGDIDNDGDLDLYVTTWGGQQNRLYINNGYNFFVERTSGVETLSTNSYNSFSSTFGDYDNDGDIDLFVANYSDTANRLYKNTGNGHFVLVENIVSDDRGSTLGGSWGDFDNDGDLDLLVANAPFWLPGTSNFYGHNRLFRNDGDDEFNEVIVPGMSDHQDRYRTTSSAMWVDVDNDGWIDIYTTNATGPNHFYKNNHGVFTEVRQDVTPDIPHTRTGGQAWGDFDNDGDLDLYTLGVAGHSNMIFRNNTRSHAWLKVKLIGTASNKYGYGAKVAVFTRPAYFAVKHIGPIRYLKVQHIDPINVYTKELTNVQGKNAQQDPSLLFGLGDAKEIIYLEVTWPSGVKNVYEDIDLNKSIELIEDASSLDG